MSALIIPPPHSTCVPRTLPPLRPPATTTSTPHKQKAFTLLELLIAIGIMLLLIAILIPALAAARRSARIADSRRQLTSLRAACQAYYQLFSDYPGPISETDLANDMGYSGSQNLALGLMGTLQNLGGSNNDGQFIPPTGNGNRSRPRDSTKYFPLPATSKPDFSIYALMVPTNIIELGTTTTFAAVYTPGSAELQPLNSSRIPTRQISANWGDGYGNALGAYPFANSQLTAPHDRFADPLPILYFRRNYGVTTPILGENATTSLAGSPAPAPSAAFYRASNIACLGTNGGATIQVTSPTGRTCPQTATPAINAQLTAELTDPSSGNPRGSFVLISAGEDRIYGTPDDLIDYGGN